MDLQDVKKYVDVIDGNVVLKFPYVEMKISMVALLKMAAEKSENKLDDSLVEMIEAALAKK